MTLISDLVFKNYCVQSISPILFDAGFPNLGWWYLLGWRSGAYHFESLWPLHWLLASFLGFSCYITAYFPQMCLMLDKFLWGHSSRVFDISCFFMELLWRTHYGRDPSGPPAYGITHMEPMRNPVALPIWVAHIGKVRKDPYMHVCWE